MIFVTHEMSQEFSTASLDITWIWFVRSDDYNFETVKNVIYVLIQLLPYGRPGLSVLTSLLVFVDVKIY